MDQFLCPHFKKQRRRFFPVKLCTVRVNIFLYCKFICRSPFSNVHIPTHVWSWIWIFVHWKTQYQYPVSWNDKNPFSKAGKEKADVSVRLLKEMMETSRAKQGKHYFKEHCKWKKTKKKKTKRANKIDTIRYQTSEFLIERRGFFYCTKYAEIIHLFFVQNMLNFQFPFFQSALNTHSIFIYSLPCSWPRQLTSVQPIINPIIP